MSRLALTAAAAAPVSTPDINTVWVVDDMQSIRPNTPTGSATSITIEAARGEYVAVQPIVTATNQALTNVRVTTSFPNSEVYRESYINVPTSSPHWAGVSTPLPPGWFPDGLIPTHDPATGDPIPVGAELRAQNATVALGTHQPYWVDIYVPYGTPAGDQFGTITVQTNQGTATLSVTLHVWNFDLPLKPSLKSCFGMWQNNHIKQDYLTIMKHRIQVQSPANFEPDLKLLGMHVNDLGQYAHSGGCNISNPPSQSTLQSLMNSHAAGISVYNYTADEVSGCSGINGVVTAWGNALHAVGCKQLITMVPRPVLYNAVDYWPILPVQYVDDDPDIAAVTAAGGEMWSYSALNQDNYSPKWLLDFPPIDHRIYGFINQSMGIKGLLYWTIDYWTSNPWSNPYSYEGYAGDGSLIYPGNRVGTSSIAPSIRLKQVRASVQDYEYIAILRSLGQASWALQQIAPIAQNWQNWSRNTNSLKAVRHTLGEQIEASI